MAGLFDKQAETYLDARPTYPADWYSMLADRTCSHSRAWDVGTGNGQAAIGVAEHYEQVIGTDVSEAQLKIATPHPRVKYLHTPLSLSDDDLINLIGENSVDLVTVAQAVHWFDLPRFYSIINRVLRKPNGVFAVWGYNDFAITPEIDAELKRFHESTIPYWNEKIRYVFDGYKTLPFPFENIGMGSEGKPLNLEIPKELSLEGVLGMLRSWSAVVTAKEKGVDLLSENVVGELEKVWGGSKVVRRVVYKGFMLAVQRSSLMATATFEFYPRINQALTQQHMFHQSKTILIFFKNNLNKANMSHTIKPTMSPPTMISVNCYYDNEMEEYMYPYGRDLPAHESRHNRSGRMRF